MLKSWIKNDSPEIVASIAMAVFWAIHPNRQFGLAHPSNECWKVWTRTGSYYTRREMPLRGSQKMQERKYSKYTMDGFCSISSTDVVVDVGAFLGEFTLPASDAADRVLAIEPDPKSYQCLRQQVKNRPNISTLNMLPRDEARTVQFNVASDGSESSLLKPDRSDYEGIEMSAEPLSEIFVRGGTNHVDFLKLDAEGMEPEVLRGIGEFHVRKFAIDTGAEREREETTSEVVDMLESRGYDTRVRREDGSVVTFARSRNKSP